MTEFQESGFGLILPVEPEDAKPDRVYGAIEIRDEDQRKECERALDLLWKASCLHYPHAVMNPDLGVMKDRYRLFRFFAESLLGPDTIEFETLT